MSGRHLCARLLSVATGAIVFRPKRPSSIFLPKSQRRVHTVVSQEDGDEFRYVRLRPNAQKLETFRLVELLPGRPGDAIRCRLQEVSTDTPTAYEAVSYCWGATQNKTTIECNSKRLRIPSSLAAALGGLRLRDRPRHLWADAICIDQSDPLDKAIQVPRMRSIYSGSQRTIVWLGSVSDSGAPPISLAVKACVYLAVPTLGLAERKGAPTVRVVDSRTGEVRKRRVYSGGFYLSLAMMLGHEWFRRAWVVQEVAVSRRVTILFDHLEYEWDGVVAALEFMSGLKFPLAFLPSPQHLAAIDRERNLFASLSSSLPGVLLRHQRCRATDQRDKIFAFAGLANPTSTAKYVRVTYTDAPAVVFRELATNVITSDKSLDILSRLPTKETKTAISLPSWVPNWTSEPDLDRSYAWSFGPVTLAGIETRDGPDKPCRFAATRQSRYEQPNILDDTLTVPGHSLGTVAYAGPSFPGVCLPSQVSRFRDILKGWKQCLRSVLEARDVLLEWEKAIVPGTGASPPATPEETPLYPPTGETMDIVFWQTICAQTYMESPALQKAARIWERLMRSRVNSVFLTGVLRSFDAMGAFYATLVFVAVLLKNDPLIEHRLQGWYVLNRRMVKLQDGSVGLVDRAVQVGDEIFLLQGSNVPLVLQKRENGDTWRLVGDAYLHGFMDGEAWDENKCRPIRIT
ncbi:HET-domain-containing protein [Echria macrotheca]|uniref:HET-domain-containing protein n=1 Tax=Echria macrotheca TaxID=438768 RepID=A0AAJ0F7U5_9PEZI|nr:HET-domain-containing protein [Echria macrotheca]